jgi:hypothetical protein
MREAPLRLGPSLIAALQQARKGSFSPEPWAVAVTPLPVQPPPKSVPVAGTPMWRNPDRAKEILDQEASALELTTAIPGLAHCEAELGQRAAGRRDEERRGSCAKAGGLVLWGRAPAGA